MPPRSCSQLTASWIAHGLKSRIEICPSSRTRDSASWRYRSRVFGWQRSAGVVVQPVLEIFGQCTSIVRVRVRLTLLPPRCTQYLRRFELSDEAEFAKP